MQANGLFHAKKPIFAYKLSDFQRQKKTATIFDRLRMKIFIPISGNKHNKELRKYGNNLLKYYIPT